MSNDYSQASSNFSDTMDSGVDARTGRYTVSLLLANLKANGGNGPNLPLTLTYDPTNTANIGFGQGWGFAWAQFDINRTILSLSTGDKYVYRTKSDHQNELIDQKIINTKLVQVDDGYHVQSRNGEVHELTKIVNGNYYMPSRIVTPNGLGVTLKWQQNGRLIEITEELPGSDGSIQTLVTLDYSEGAYANITLWPGRDIEKTIKLTIRSSNLVAITHGDQIWNMTYDQDIKNFGTAPLCKVEYPNGCIDTVKYVADGQGHKYPDCANTQLTIPYVLNYQRKVPGHKELSEIKYEFSENNYLGYNSSLSNWDPNTDNLYETTEQDYEYFSIRSIYKGNGKYIKSKNIYNKFHLLKETTIEEYSSDDQSEVFTQKLENTYELSHGNLNQQVNHFQLPIKEKTTYIDSDGKSKSFTTVNEYDQDANKIKSTLDNNSVEIWEYYDAAGEGEDCPAAPLGVRSYLKSHTIIPVNPEGVTTPKATTINKYKLFSIDQIRGTKNSTVSSVILPVSSETYSDETLINKRNMEYHETSDIASFLRLKKQTNTYYDTNNKPYETSETTTYTLENGQLTTNSVQTSYDGLTKTITGTICAYTGAALARTTALGNKETYSYDSLGRIKKHSLCEDDPVYNYVITYDRGKQLSENGIDELFFSSQTDPNGITNKQVLSGLGNVLSEFNNTEDEEFKLLEQTYDPMGCLLTVNQFDQVSASNHCPSNQNNTTAKAGNVTLQNKKVLTYDYWGQLLKRTLDNGVSYTCNYDPLNSQSSDFFGDDSRLQERFIEFDSNQKPTKIHRKNAKGEIVSTEVVSYDGLGRLVTHTDALNRTTSYQYDAYNRVIKCTYPDGTLVTKTYAPHSEKQLITSISVNGTCIGEQKFDGLERLISRTVGGRTHSYSYKDAAATKPSSATLPDGTTMTYERIPQLGEAIKKVTSSDGTYRSFDYDPITGLPTRIEQSSPKGEASESVITLVYDKRGRLINQTINNLQENTIRTVKYEYSIGGSLTQYTDADGNLITFKYDEYGRRSQVKDKNSTSRIFYDETNGLISGWQTVSGTHHSDVKIEYDNFSRKTSITLNDNKTYMRLKVNYTYNEVDQIIKKEVENSNYQNKLIETYQYDNRKRLINTKYEGDGRPEDKNIGPINEITYKYGSLNLNTVTSISDNGKSTQKYYYESLADIYQLTSTIYSYTNNNGNNNNITYYYYDKCGYLAGKRQDSPQSKLESFSYDAFGNLSEVTNTENNSSTTYQYDGRGQLRLQKSSDGKKREFFYLANMVVSEIVTIAGKESFIGRTFDNNAYLTQYTDAETPIHFGTDVNGSILTMSQNDKDTLFTYTPYGERSENNDQHIPAFNGQIIDLVTGYYHLGHGYRTYMPDIMCFNKPDSESPFGAGGLNWYAYCEGDPVNNTDPSGHYSVHHSSSNTADIIISALIGVALTLISVVLFREPIMQSFKIGGGKNIAKGVMMSLSVVSQATAAAMGVAAAAEKPRNPKLAASLEAASQTTAIIAMLPFFAGKQLSPLKEDLAVASKGIEVSTDTEDLDSLSSVKAISRETRSSSSISSFSSTEQSIRTVNTTRTSTIVSVEETSISSGITNHLERLTPEDPSRILPGSARGTNPPCQPPAVPSNKPKLPLTPTQLPPPLPTRDYLHSPLVGTSEDVKFAFQTNGPKSLAEHLQEDGKHLHPPKLA